MGKIKLLKGNNSISIDRITINENFEHLHTDVDTIQSTITNKNIETVSNKVTNQSTVLGTTVTDALESLKNTVLIPGATGVAGATGADSTVQGPAGATGAAGATGSVGATGTSSANTIYTANDTIGTGRVATLTDTLNFSEGTFNLFGLDKDKKVSYVSGDSSFASQTTYVDNALNFKFDSNTGTGQLWAITSSSSSGKLNVKGSEVLIENIKTNDNLIVSGNSVASGGTRAIEIPFGTSGTWKGVNMFATQKGGGGADFEIQVSPAGLGGTYETALKIAKDKTVSLLSSATIQGIGTSTGSTLALYNNDTTPTKLWDFLDNGNVNLGAPVVFGSTSQDMVKFESSGLNPSFIINASNTASNTNMEFEKGGVKKWLFGNTGSNDSFRIYNYTAAGSSIEITNANKINLLSPTLTGGDLNIGKATSIDTTNTTPLYIKCRGNGNMQVEIDSLSTSYSSQVKYSQGGSQKWLTGVDSSQNFRFYDFGTSSTRLSIKPNTTNISIPTSATGLSSGDLWNDGGTVKIA